MVMYLVAALSFVLPLAGTVLFRMLLRKDEAKCTKALRIYSLVLGGIALAAFFCFIFFVPLSLTTENAGEGKLNPDVGLVNLIGVPYGDNKIGNFFAWFAVSMFLPTTALASMNLLLPSRKGAFLQRYIVAPNLILLFAGLFLVRDAYLNGAQTTYKIVLLGLAMGLACASSASHIIISWKEAVHYSVKEIVFGVIYFILAWCACMPMCTMAALFPTEGSILGTGQTVWRVYDFSFMHRFFIYLGMFYYFTLYFMIRDDEENLRRSMLLVVAFGALASFFTRYGFEGIFDVNNGYKLWVRSLPIHLCHTALFVVPLCIGFKLRRLFYFTYFINVFGALMAMIFPNSGETSNIYSPDVLLFWYNHMAAMFMPLLAVMLGMFPRPKMKSMGWSLLSFLVYFVFILFANAYLSNFVPGYDPAVPDSGTDYLFINGTYILDILGKEARHMLDVKISFELFGQPCQIYPLYQGIFFGGYAAIAFAMWFVYSLFYKIEDSHRELHDRLVVARATRLTWKERTKMETISQQEIDHLTPSLQFIDFSKRYLSSARLSADHVNLTASGGEIFGFLGPNGAGKSTCIKTAIGIQPVTEGRISVCGFDVAQEPVKAKRCIGYVPDHYALYEKLTGREYINYIADLYKVPKAERDERIAYYVDLFELTASFDARMQTYSHGMKQKIAIIAALVHDPKVWILDEPLTGLDPQSIYQVKQTMIHHAEKGNVVFFSSHIIDVVERLCTRIAIIRKGQIVYTGTMEETLANHPEGLEEFYLSFTREDEDEQ